MRLWMLVPVLVFAACDGGDTEDSGSDSGTVEPQEACGDLGVNGGVLELGDASLRVPAGALDGDVELCLVSGEQAAPADFELVSEVYSIKPTVVAFASDVTLSAPAGEATDLAGYTSIDGSTWAAQKVSRLGDQVEVTLTRGGHAFLAELSTTTEEFSFDDVPPQDVLFVVDDSCSMAEEQEKLAAGFDAFFTEIEGMDWHIGIVTTDMVNFERRGKLVAHADGDTVLDSNDTDPAVRFNSMVVVGTNGDANEAGRDAAHAALVTRAMGANQGFLREGAGLSVVFISDENDYSTNAVQLFPNFLASRPDVPRVYSIVGLTNNTSDACALERGELYIELADSFPGGTYDICAESYASFLTEIGQGVAGGGAPVVTLGLPPDPATIVVSTLDGAGAATELTAEQWTYLADSNAVRLASRPTEGFSVRVTYLPAFE